MEQKDDCLVIGGHEFHSRFILGSGKYSLNLIEAAVKDAGAEIITMAVRRANTDFLIDSSHLSPSAREKKHRLETDPSSRTNHMEYQLGMEQIQSDVMSQVMGHVDLYEDSQYTAMDVQAALQHDRCTIEDFKALISPAAEPFLEQMAQKARLETRKHFGNSVYLFTPLYIANYCDNYCVYCGFNCYNDIHRMQLNMEQIEHEMKVIADSGMEEILMLTGEAFSALLGLSNFRKDALATALHAYYLQRKYPAAEMSLSCPRLRPIINNDKINPLDVGETQLCQILCAYRIFLPFAGITVSSRESAEFRNGIVKIAATKVSAGVSTGIGDHESKYTGQETRK